jgi:hypothetical protein
MSIVIIIISTENCKSMSITATRRCRRFPWQSHVSVKNEDTGTLEQSVYVGI